MKKVLLALALAAYIPLSSCATPEGKAYEGIIVSVGYRENAEKLSECLSLVPERVMNAVMDAGYSIELTENPGSEFGMKHLSGLTIPELKVIYIKDNVGKFRQAAVHEVFHAYDDTLGFISEGDEFVALYEAEKDLLEVTGFISAGQYKSSPKEYFAESCQMYVYDRETLKKSAPLTFTYIDALLEP